MSATLAEFSSTAIYVLPTLTQFLLYQLIHLHLYLYQVVHALFQSYVHTCTHFIDTPVQPDYITVRTLGPRSHTSTP